MTGLTTERKELQDFEPLVGTTFSIVAENLPPLPMVLEEVRPLKRNSPEMRAPFELTFRGGEEILQQGLYQFTHEDMGDVVIFIVPAAKDDKGVQYCATFN